MSRIDTDRLPGLRAPVLDAGLLARIQDLNLDYVELLIAEHAAPSAATQLQHLHASVCAAIAALTPAARGALAGTPFTLYSLGFEDEASWLAACECTAGPLAERYMCTEAASLQVSFCELALLHAWHVAASNRLAARVLYAMPDAIGVRFAGTPLWKIKRIAGQYPELLMPRWPTNPAFWPDLVHFATLNDSPRLATAQLLGSQLIAAELECSSGMRGAGMGRMSPSPRLRACRKLGLRRR
jgi:hypothetical protein